jgi:hypothetical protein
MSKYNFVHVARILRIHAHLNGGDPSLVDSCNAANAVIAEMERRDARYLANEAEYELSQEACIKLANASEFERQGQAMAESLKQVGHD